MIGNDIGTKGSKVRFAEVNELPPDAAVLRIDIDHVVGGEASGLIMGIGSEEKDVIGLDLSIYPAGVEYSDAFGVQLGIEIFIDVERDIVLIPGDFIIVLLD
jgi:hypothetical protein